jgi:hypothetical protein
VSGDFSLDVLGCSSDRSIWEKQNTLAIGHGKNNVARKSGEKSKSFIYMETSGQCFYI